MTHNDARLLPREAAERLEAELLRPGAVLSADAWQRPQSEAPDPFRTCFVRDRDRVLHCAAFRRLKDKTQVFVVDQDDFYRTRLTHTLEVTQIARSIARALRLNESLAEVLALVHDIGHPPFGHEGERILRDVTGADFDHNGQALRIVDLLESPYHDRRGLNLTHVVRRMILKHGGEAGWGAAPTASHVLEAQVTDLADSLAYQHHDLEDALRAGVLARDDLHELSIWRQAVDEAGRPAEGKRGTKATLNAMLKRSIHDLIEHSFEALAAIDPADPAEVEAHEQTIIGFSDERARQHAELMRFLYARFYRSDTVVSSRTVAQEALDTIARHYRAHPGDMPEAYRRRLDGEGLERTLCDYVAGMTDRYALDAYRRLQGAAPTVVPAPPLLDALPSDVAIDEGLDAAISELEAVIEHDFAEPNLAAMALTHASARGERTPPNERLEFLGDAVLGLIVAQACYRRFPDVDEGELSRIKANAVNRNALLTVAEDWDLRPLIVLGPGFREGDTIPDSIVGDAVEAVLGAVYLDAGLAAVRTVILAHFGAIVDAAAEGRRSQSPKSELQAYTQGAFGLTPHYRVVGESGPDHRKAFAVSVLVGDREVARGEGRNKRTAEIRAAKTALALLRHETGLAGDEVTTPDGGPDDGGPDDDGPDDDGAADEATTDVARSDEPAPDRRDGERRS